MTCLCCKGTGKTHYTVHGEAPGVKHEITCHYCKGSGTMTPDQKRAWDGAQNFWCKCVIQRPEDQRYYEYADGTHGWACTVCGKVRQIG